MTPILPPETWDHIIDLLDSDYSALTTCMLVCKSWEPRSRHNLPGWMAFANRDEIVQVAQDNGTLWKGPRNVQILGGTMDERKPIPHLTTFAAMLAGPWTRVRMMQIKFAEWRARDMTPLIFLHLSAFSSVTTLDLSHVTFPSIVALRRLIWCFPNLRSLHFLDVSFLVYGATPPGFAGCPQELMSLEYSAVGIRLPTF